MHWYKYCLKFHSGMRTFIFYKLTGAGNDFILFDLKDNHKLDITPHLAGSICSRRFGIGADGILVIKDSDGFDFEMAYYNADGTTGSLCGNGARCAIKYASASGRLNKGTANFAVNGIHYSGAVIDDEKIAFNFNEPEDLLQNLSFIAGEQVIKGSFINTGAPHLVINIKDVLSDIGNPSSFHTDIDSFPAYELGKKIRYSETFSPAGVNVNFISTAEDVIKIRTYERGVEDETLACGTGSTAAAMIASLEYGYSSPVSLKTKGGDILTVAFKRKGLSFENVTLTGPAKIVFKGEITI